MSIGKGTILIDSMEAWQKYARPKRADQWKDGRSAKEMARAWLNSGTALPAEVSTALEAHQSFGEVHEWEAEPEKKLRFDSFAGEPRNCDLVVDAKDANGLFLIAVEGKADEPFGETTADAVANAVDRRLENPASNALLRIQQLAAALLGPRVATDPPLKDIRYQLLTACAGAICHAENLGYSRALVLIHEFITHNTSDKNHKRNNVDLNLFVRRLSHGAVQGIGVGQIYGPFPVAGAPLFSGKVALFLGKVARNLRAASY